MNEFIAMIRCLSWIGLTATVVIVVCAIIIAKHNGQYKYGKVNYINHPDYLKYRAA